MGKRDFYCRGLNSFICDRGIRNFFNLPKGVFDFDILVSSNRLKHSYKAKLDSNYQYTKLQFCGSDASRGFITVDEAITNALDRMFGNKTFYFALEY